MSSEQQKALGQPQTNQNTQQQETKADTVVTANLKNWSSLSLFGSEPDLSMIAPNLLENPDILVVYGQLTTSSLFNRETVLAPPSRLDFTYEQFLPDAEIQIIVAGETDNAIINATTVTTDESGFFWTSVHAPPPRVLLVIAYFEGSENIFPTYDAEYLCEIC